MTSTYPPLRTELFAIVPDTVRQVSVPVHASHYFVVNYFHEICTLSLFATTQATGKRQNIAAKLKVCKKRKVKREKCKQEKTEENKGERIELKQILEFKRKTE